MSSLASKAASNSSISRHTGYLHHELYLWHNPGPWGNLREFVQPARYAEHSETKRRLHNLVNVSGLIDQLKLLRPRPATVAELTRAHSQQYVQSVMAMSEDHSKAVHRVGDETAFMPGGFDIAALAAGGALTATDEVLAGAVANAYVLCRPPGHHAERGMGGGYCLFNNVAVAALHALTEHHLSRVAIVDFDVHHGNGTQQIFYEDDRVMFISLHQDSNYPLHSGAVSEVGAGRGLGTTINIPLPPGSGSGAYRAAFDRVVAPALSIFQPELIMVSAGYDASYMDPLGQMMLGSEDFSMLRRRLLDLLKAPIPLTTPLTTALTTALTTPIATSTNIISSSATTASDAWYFMRVLQQQAEQHCSGRLVAVHEGGYSELYVPFCGLAVIEQMSSIKTKVDDPYWPDVSNFGYQALQPHQDAAIKQAEQQLRLLTGAMQGEGCKTVQATDSRTP
eukprot:gene6585-6813_t